MMDGVKPVLEIFYNWKEPQKPYRTLSGVVLNKIDTSFTLCHGSKIKLVEASKFATK